MQNNQNKLNIIPENYRVSRNIWDFSVDSVVYFKSDVLLVKGVVSNITKDYVIIRWEGRKYETPHTSGSYACIYVQDKQPSKPTDIVKGTRVRWCGAGTIGVVTEVTDNEVSIQWDSLFSSTYLLSAYASQIEAVSDIEPEVQGQNLRNGSPIQPLNSKSNITLDLKLTLDFSNEGIRAVIMECVYAVLKQEKYQEAKELCDLLISLKGLEDQTKDKP